MLGGAGDSHLVPKNPVQLNTLSLRPVRSTIALMISALFKTLYSALGTQSKLALENLALRQQASSFGAPSSGPV